MLPAKQQRPGFYFCVTSTLKRDDCINNMVPISNGSSSLEESASLLNCPLVPVGTDRWMASGLIITFLFMCMYICIVP